MSDLKFYFWVLSYRRHKNQVAALVYLEATDVTLGPATAVALLGTKPSCHIPDIRVREHAMGEQREKRKIARKETKFSRKPDGSYFHLPIQFQMGSFCRPPI